MLCRRATPVDEDEIVVMGAADVAETLPGVVFSEQRGREALKLGFTTGQPRVMVVEHDGRLLGFSMSAIGQLYYTEGLFVLIEVIYVEPKRRGSRAALLLGQEFVRWGLEDVKAKRLFAGNINAFASERLAQFWERFGFRRVGIQLMRDGV